MKSLAIIATLITLVSCSFESMGSIGASAQYPFGKATEGTKKLESSTSKPDESLGTKLP